MKIYFSLSHDTFYNTVFHKPGQIPADAIEISREEHSELVRGRAGGKQVVLHKGVPVLVDKPAPSMSDRRARALAVLEEVQEAYLSRQITAVDLLFDGNALRRWVHSHVVAHRAKLKAEIESSENPESVSIDFGACDATRPQSRKGLL